MKLNRSGLELPDLAMVEVLRKKSGQERVEIGFGLWRFARQIILAGIRDQHPDWTREQVERQAARRMSGGAF